MQRVIGRYKGSRPGPLVLVFGAIHGNEPAGVKAIQEVFQMLEKEPAVNPGFQFHGQLTGMVGNLQAFLSNQRFLKKDLNREWTTANYQRLCHMAIEDLEDEDLELVQLCRQIKAEIEQYQPETLVLLDLHTTSADGGIFCIPSDDKTSLRLAKELHAPVILGLMDGIFGTLLQYAVNNQFEIGGLPKKTIGVAFEGGRHEDPVSTSRLISAIISCLRACDCIHSKDVDNRHEAILLQYSNQLPKVTRLKHVHPVRPGDAFVMRPGYVNFQAIREGEHLADDVSGPIYAPLSGLILMPLYQPKGSDGFFIVEELGVG